MNVTSQVLDSWSERLPSLAFLGHLLRSNWDDAPPATDESSRTCRLMSVEVNDHYSNYPL